METSAPANLVVRVPNWIGDAVMCLPALMDLRDHFSHAKITVLAKPAIGDLLNGHPAVDEIMVIPQECKGGLGLVKLIRRVKKRQFTQAVLFQNAFEAAILSWAAGIPSRIGYATDGRSCLLSESIPPPPPTLHQTLYYQHLVTRITRSTGKKRTPQLFLAPEVTQACVRKFPDVFSSSNRIMIGINPGSVYGSAKRWMPERFAEVGDRLVEEVGPTLARCVVIGGKGEEVLGQYIARRMQYPPIVLSGKTSIQELMGVLARCVVLVTNDTGPMHVAQALGVPVAAIFGSTDSSSSGPLGESQGMVKASVRCAPCFLRACPIDHRCMTQVSIEQVTKVASSHIRKALGSGEDRLRGPLG